MTLNFKDWEKLNEANLVDDIKNWMSGAFGGSVSKIENIASEYKSSEMKYVDEWEDIQVEIDKLELERSQTKNDPAEIKRIDRLIQRNRDLMDAQSKSHEKQMDLLLSKVKEIVSSKKRIRTYWEKLKTQIDAEVAEDMYKKAKDLADSSLSGSLYNKYKNAVLKAKDKDSEFREKYGNLMTKEIQNGPKKPEIRQDKSSGEVAGVEGEASFEVLAKLPIIEFSDAVKGFSKPEIKKLINYLLKERNDRYVAMDMEKELIDKDPEAGKGLGIKEIKEKYMSEIRDLRSKITVARKYA